MNYYSAGPYRMASCLNKIYKYLIGNDEIGGWPECTKLIRLHLYLIHGRTKMNNILMATLTEWLQMSLSFACGKFDNIVIWHCVAVLCQRLIDLNVARSEFLRRILIPMTNAGTVKIAKYWITLTYSVPGKSGGFARPNEIISQKRHSIQRSEDEKKTNHFPSARL